jgi:hypothetical protein
MIIFDARKSIYFRYKFGKKKIIKKKIKYFHIIYLYLNYDNQFGETLIALEITTFKNVKSIDKFQIFLFKFYPNQKKITKYIMKCGKKFVHLKNQHYIRYHGNTFCVTDRRYVEIPINNRIIVDILCFRKINPNYIRSTINKLTQSPNSRYIHADNNPDQIKNNNFNPTSLNKNDLIIYYQTIYNWSFNNK